MFGSNRAGGSYYCRGGCMINTGPGLLGTGRPLQQLVNLNFRLPLFLEQRIYELTEMLRTMLQNAATRNCQLGSRQSMVGVGSSSVTKGDEIEPKFTRRRRSTKI